MKIKKNSKFHIFLPLFFGIFLLLGLAPAAMAEGLIEVHFETSPLFQEGQFLPGDSTVRTFSVKNTSGGEQEAEIKATDEVRGGLENALKIEIASGEKVYFSESLADFFQASSVSLGELLGGQEKTYTVTVSFANQGNAYQEKTTGFGLCVGFQSANETCFSDTADQTNQSGIDGQGASGGGFSGGHLANFWIHEPVDLSEPLSVRSLFPALSEIFGSEFQGGGQNGGGETNFADGLNARILNNLLSQNTQLTSSSSVAAGAESAEKNPADSDTQTASAFFGIPKPWMGIIEIFSIVLLALLSILGIFAFFRSSR
ncbi:MAG TPA: hypothetical protein VFM02_01910 [Candidatus Paceibacterota bacterium]|nr:hypothetical protein [Candidatus Paceibacterota bacterium]